MDETVIDVHEFREFLDDVTARLVKDNYHRAMTWHEWRLELQRELSRRKAEQRERPANGRVSTRPEPHPDRSNP